jgi:transcription elongation factor GreA
MAVFVNKEGFYYIILFERVRSVAREAKFKMSAERYEQIKQELEYLQTVREKEVAEQIREARSFGDLSENSEYDEAKIEQGKLYSKIAELNNLIENAEIIEDITDTGKIVMGSAITVLDLDLNEEQVYRIVGSQEANPMEGKISDESPFGAALLGCKKGDRVRVDAPSGTLNFEILEINK